MANNKNITLKSGKKITLLEMSVDDIDSCTDKAEPIFEDGEVKTMRNLSKARTLWMRKGVKDCDDKLIKSLTEEDKTELVLSIQEYQKLGVQQD